MTSDTSPSPAHAGLPGPRGPATPYRMTVTTALPHADALALADQRLGAWLKQEGCEEPPPVVRERAVLEPADQHDPGAHAPGASPDAASAPPPSASGWATASCSTATAVRSGAPAAAATTAAGCARRPRTAPTS